MARCDIMLFITFDLFILFILSTFCSTACPRITGNPRSRSFYFHLLAIKGSVYFPGFHSIFVITGFLTLTPVWVADHIRHWRRLVVVSFLLYWKIRPPSVFLLFLSLSSGLFQFPYNISAFAAIPPPRSDRGGPCPLCTICISCGKEGFTAWSILTLPGPCRTIFTAILLTPAQDSHIEKIEWVEGIDTQY